MNTSIDNDDKMKQFFEESFQKFMSEQLKGQQLAQQGNHVVLPSFSPISGPSHPIPLVSQPPQTTVQHDQNLIAANEKLVSSKRKWGEAFFEVLPSGKRKCRLHLNGTECNCTFGSKTNISNCADHVTIIHKVPIPSRLSKDLDHDISLISDYFSPTMKVLRMTPQEEKILLAFAMNPIAMQTLDDKYFRAAFGSVLGTLHRKELRDKLLRYGAFLHQEKMKLYNRVLLSIQFDGGKDVAQNKIIAVSTFSGSNVTLYDMVDTQLAVLDEQYYEQLIKRIVENIIQSGAFVVSITLDNEASPNAGVRSAIDKYFAWMYHIRCGCHTIELELQVIYSSFPEVTKAVELARDIAIKCRNTKALSKAFVEAQNALKLRPKPLKFLLPSNTRQWSSGYLVISRLLLLRPAYMVVRSQEEFGSVLPELDWTALTITKEILFELYYRIQILQRNISNIIHHAWCWKGVLGLVAKYKNVLTAQNQFDLLSQLEKGTQTHHEKIVSSSLYYLALAMWPTRLKSELSDSEYAFAVKELVCLIEKQWDLWCVHRSVLGLSIDYTEANMIEFVAGAKRELQMHLVPLDSDLFIRNQKARCQKHCEAYETQLRTSLKMPMRATKKEVDFVVDYWLGVGSSLPCLNVVYSVLRVCAASEAQCERYFSSEAILHSVLRNRMDPDLVKSILNIRFNQKFVVEQMESLTDIEDDSIIFIESDDDSSDDE